ncbi:MAG: hypothetical protein GVY26_16590 [Bacteroidetes bacterium]|nr:hypothetical protein [Bacteroidota bacterium]
MIFSHAFDWQGLCEGQIVKSSPITYNASFRAQVWESCEQYTHSSIVAYSDIQRMLMS